MKNFATILLSLSICALAWVAGRTVDKGVKITFLHIIATPGDLKK